ncbi:MAG: MBL fold metallo-hydrolase, partial [Lautropia sp.]|nr:MBL fold metallo-hydrolase [Lautropia sp.]
ESNLIGRSPNAPKAPLPMRPLRREDFGVPDAGFAYYWLGHSSAILELAGKRILVDPVFGNAAPVEWSFVMARFQPPPLARNDLPPIDVVLITHDHYDHLEAATMRHLADKVSRFVVPLGVGARLQSWGVPAERITELGWGDGVTIGGVKVTAETARHFSARWTSDRNRTLWVSYALEGAGKRLYWGADGGYGRHFAQLGEKYRGFDIAFIEIDAANPGWPGSHLFPDEVIRAAQDLRAQVTVPIHWAVFNLGRNPWDSAIRRVHELAGQQDVRLDVPRMGERYTPEAHRPVPWWEGVE